MVGIALPLSRGAFESLRHRGLAVSATPNYQYFLMFLYNGAKSLIICGFCMRSCIEFPVQIIPWLKPEVSWMGWFSALKDGVKESASHMLLTPSFMAEIVKLPHLLRL